MVLQLPRCSESWIHTLQSVQSAMIDASMKELMQGREEIIFLFLLFTPLIVCVGCIGNPFTDQAILRHEMVEDSYQDQIYEDQMEEQQRQDALEEQQREDQYYRDQMEEQQREDQYYEDQMEEQRRQDAQEEQQREERYYDDR